MPLWFCFCVRLFACPFHHFSCLIYTPSSSLFSFFFLCRTCKSSAHSFTFGIPNGNHGCFCMLFFNVLNFSTSNHIVAHCNSEEKERVLSVCSRNHFLQAIRLCFPWRTSALLVKMSQVIRGSLALVLPTVSPTSTVSVWSVSLVRCLSEDCRQT